MTDETQNIVLQHLRAIRAQNEQLTHKATEIASTQSAMLQILANQGSRLDRMEARIERIETRLGLIEA